MSLPSVKPETPNKSDTPNPVGDIKHKARIDVMKILRIFQKWIYELHLYDNKGESLFKTVALWFSWGGGILTDGSVSSYYLFSATIITEYAVQLVRAKKFVPKLLPIVLVLSNLLIWLGSGFQIMGANFKNETNCFFEIELGTLLIISIDTIVSLIIEPPEETYVEANLGNCSGKTTE